MKSIILITFIFSSFYCSQVIGQIQPLQITNNVHDHLFLSEINDSGINEIHVVKTEIYHKSKRKNETEIRKAYSVQFDWNNNQAEIVFYDKGNLYVSDKPSENSDFYFLSSIGQVHLQGNSSSLIRWNSKYQIIQLQNYSDTSFNQLNSEINYFYSNENLIGKSKNREVRQKW
jgi:hypothetical protein